MYGRPTVHNTIPFTTTLNRWREGLPTKPYKTFSYFNFPVWVLFDIVYGIVYCLKVKFHSKLQVLFELVSVIILDLFQFKNR